MARNATDEAWGYLDQRRYVLHDRDTKFCSQFRATLAAGSIKPIQLPARSPNLGPLNLPIEVPPGRGIRMRYTRQLP
jgi:hypothetical protein